MATLHVSHTEEFSSTSRSQGTTNKKPSLFKATLEHVKLNRAEQGKGTVARNSLRNKGNLNAHPTRTTSVTFSQTGGLHIAVSETSTSLGKCFTYNLILDLGLRNSDLSIDPFYVDAVSISFPKSREIKVSDFARSVPTTTVIDNCYAWFYIPLDGILLFDSTLMNIARSSTDQIMKHHGGQLPRSNMQDHIITSTIRCISSHLIPSYFKNLKIQDSAKKAFREDTLKLGGPGKFLELSSDGSWKVLLRP